MKVHRLLANNRRYLEVQRAIAFESTGTIHSVVSIKNGIPDEWRCQYFICEANLIKIEKDMCLHSLFKTIFVVYIIYIQTNY